MSQQHEAMVQRFAFTAEQIDLIKRTIFPTTLTNDEFALSIEVCNRLGLDPFAKELHVQKRKQRGRDGEPDTYKLVFITGIDGYRRRASETGEADGQIGPQWCGEDGVWKDVWVTPRAADGSCPFHPPYAARVGVKRKGCSEPFWGIAHWDEYRALEPTGWSNGRVAGWKLSSMWEKMPAGQLGKCAEALGLRKAFPRELGPLRTTEEMARSEHEEVVETVSATYTKPTVEEKQAQRTQALAEQLTIKAAAPPVPSPVPVRGMADYIGLEV